MTRKNWIDDFLERFQHRWEMNPQYRAAMSGVLGLVFLITICGCVGAVSISATSVLHAMGIGVTANDGPNQPSGTGNDIKGVATFPITTVTPPQPGSLPYETIPASGTQVPTATPSPTPTDTPTATPCVGNNCGGGGGGGCPSCTVSDSGSPNPFVHGQSASIYVHTSQPNIGIYIIAQIPGCVTQLSDPSTAVTNGSGDLTWPMPQPICGAGHGNSNITVSAGFPSGQVYGPTIIQSVI